MNTREILKLADILSRENVPEETIKHLVLRLSPQEWTVFRHDLPPDLWGLENATWTSCTFYGIRVEVDPDAKCG